MGERRTVLLKQQHRRLIMEWVILALVLRREYLEPLDFYITVGLYSSCANQTSDQEYIHNVSINSENVYDALPGNLIKTTSQELPSVLLFSEVK